MSITFGGNEVTLEGTPIKVGDVLPSAKVVTMDMDVKDITEDFGDGVKVISMAPSLDTGVCDLQTKGFISKVGNMPGVSLITVSMDLPFAQKRWCGAAGADDATVVSDYRFREVGRNLGTMIEELQLLTRSVVVVDKDNVVRYVEFVPEVKEQVNFDAAMAAVQELAE